MFGFGACIFEAIDRVGCKRDSEPDCEPDLLGEFVSDSGTAFLGDFGPDCGLDCERGFGVIWRSDREFGRKSFGEQDACDGVNSSGVDEQ